MEIDFRAIVRNSVALAAGVAALGDEVAVLLVTAEKLAESVVDAGGEHPCVDEPPDRIPLIDHNAVEAKIQVGVVKLEQLGEKFLELGRTSPGAAARSWDLVIKRRPVRAIRADGWA